VTDGLPDDQGAFSGRRTEIDRITRLAITSDATAPVAAIHGMAGVGKTRLAVRAGHALLRDNRYTELQLSVDLHGHDPNRPPADPAAVLDGFLRRLGVPGDEIHRLDLAGRATRYRQLMAGRNALVLLDNAATADQVRPLLPRQASCLVLITSRNVIPELTGASHLNLDVLTPAESMDLLRRQSGPDIVDADPVTAGRIAQLLGHLPLALNLVAARIRDTPDWSLTDHLDRLIQHHTNLKLEQAIQAAFDLSYNDLPRLLRRAFRLLALHPADTFDAHTAAAMTGTDPAAARQHLDHLVANNLLQHTTAHRVRFHDLVHIYATQRTYDDEPAHARNLSMTRLLDHYVQTTVRAVSTLYPENEKYRDPGPLAPTPSTVDVTAPALAQAWLDTEHANLMALANSAAGRWHRHLIGLSATLWRHLDTRGRHVDALAIHRLALTAARTIGDRAAEANALRAVGTAHHRLGHYPDALDHYRQSLTMARETGDRLSECYALGNLGIVYERLGRYPEALGHYERALIAAREIDNRTAEGNAQNYLGFVKGRLGRQPEALDHYRQALLIARETDDRVGEGYALRHLGVAHEREGRLSEADEHHQRAMAIATEVGDRAGEAYSLTYLGVVRARRTQYSAALEYHQRALAIATEIGDRELEIDVLNCFGQTLRACGRADHALDRHTQALVLASTIGDRHEQARAHDGIAAAHLDLAHRRKARTHWGKALALYNDLGVPNAYETEQRLADLEAARRTTYR
jgi:tetratricopeptide (TPR) repeat protein